METYKERFKGKYDHDAVYTKSLSTVIVLEANIFYAIILLHNKVLKVPIDLLQPLYS